MSIYDFGSSFTFTNTPRGIGAAGVAGAHVSPNIDPYIQGTTQLSHVSGGRTGNWEEHRVESADIEDFIAPGFRYLDEAMKNYWSDIRVPTRDSYRFIRTKIAGGSKSLQVWIDELTHGRVQLPVISISRISHSYNEKKFSPPYLALRKRFVNAQRTMVALGYRPVPYNVEYTIDIWAEHKRDAEYINYQMLTRFNPLAELVASDEHNQGCVQMKLNSSSDKSDKEAGAEQYAKVKYEISYTAESWLSIPERVMPTILGTVHSLGQY